MNKEKTRFTLRIDKELFDIVKESAQNNRRSAAMEIEYALDAYYKLKTYADTHQRLAHINNIENDDKFNKIFKDFHKYNKAKNDAFFDEVLPLEETSND